MDAMPIDDSAHWDVLEDGTYRTRLERLLFDLWRDGVLSEQQCAKYAGTNLVGMRQALDCQALLHGYKCREDAQT